MNRLFLLLVLTPLLVLPACDTEPGSESQSGGETGSGSTVTEDADAFVATVVDNAVFLCECSLEADGIDPEQCAAGVEDEFGDDVNGCIADLMSTYPDAREGLRCSTAVFRDLLDCYENEGICPDTTTDDGGPISDDACGLAADEEGEACGEISVAADNALTECLVADEAEDCIGDEC